MPSLRSRQSRLGAATAMAGLQGWEATQEYMLSHDEDMIGDFADDIDTLLVFAGLFSAVLTAFVAVSLLTLQQDNVQVSAQVLSLIALRLGAPDETQPFLRSTASSLPSTNSFEAPVSATAINSLWLVSLVASLAAALFGILAKQWCREYLRWHSLLSSAKDNVILRQARFDAWHKGNVSGYMMSISALLELALVLFFVGLAIFSWTLDRVVAIVLTLAIGVTLVAAFVTHVLPAFFRLSPYKSPIGLAVLRLAAWGQKLVEFSFPGHANSGASAGADVTDGANSWRDHDRSSALERIDLDSIPWASHLDPSRDASLRATASELRFLVNALCWVRRATDDRRAMANIRECLPTMYGSREHLPRAALYILCQCVGWRGSFYAFQHRALSLCYERLEMRGDLSPYPQDYHWTLASQPCDTNYAPYVLDPGIMNIATANPVAVQAARLLLYESLRDLSRDFHTPWSAHSSRKLAIILGVLRCVPSPPVSYQDQSRAGPASLQDTEDTAEWAAVLVHMFSNIVVARTAENKADILLMIVQLITWMRRRLVLELKDEQWPRSGKTFVSASIWPGNRIDNYLAGHVECAHQIYQTTAEYQWAEGRRIFVAAVSHCLRSIKEAVSDRDNYDPNCYTDNMIGELINDMTNATYRSLSHSLKDLDATSSLSWIHELLSIFEGTNDNESMGKIPFLLPSVRYAFPRLLDALYECIEVGLVTTDTARSDCNRLRDIVRSWWSSNSTVVSSWRTRNSKGKASQPRFVHWGHPISVTIQKPKMIGDSPSSDGSEDSEVEASDYDAETIPSGSPAQYGTVPLCSPLYRVATTDLYSHDGSNDDSSPRTTSDEVASRATSPIPYTIWSTFAPETPYDAHDPDTRTEMSAEPVDTHRAKLTNLLESLVAKVAESPIFNRIEHTSGSSGSLEYLDITPPLTYISSPPSAIMSSTGAVHPPAQAIVNARHTADVDRISFVGSTPTIPPIALGLGLVLALPGPSPPFAPDAIWQAYVAGGLPNLVDVRGTLHSSDNHDLSAEPIPPAIELGSRGGDIAPSDIP